jgi:hypothetical protein
VPQQRQEKGKRKKPGYDLPESNRSALVEGLRSTDEKRSARGSRLQFHRKFVHVAGTLGRFDCDRSRERRLQPGREVRAQKGEGHRPVPVEHFIRFCYAGATEDKHEAVARIARWLANR